MKKILFVSFALMIVVSAFAQKKQIDDTKYRRSSLHLILLTTDDPILKEEEVMQSWSHYPFPDKYNEHSINLRTFPAGKPGVSFFEFAKKVASGEGDLLPTTLAGLKKMKEDTDGKAYIAALKTKVEDKITEEKLAHQLLEKWFGIQPNGKTDWSLIQERGCYNATETDASMAFLTTRGSAMLADAGAELISNTFVSFCKLDFYENEPIAKFYLILAEAISKFIPGGDAAVSAAQIAYEATKNGYSARTLALLYKLDWNDSIRAEFMNCYNGEIFDYQKFQSLPFRLAFVGSDVSTSTAINPFGASKELNESKLIDLTVVRNIDKLFTKMQSKYEVFRPKFAVLTNPPLTAEFGMKEGLKGGEQFEILMPVWNEKTLKLEYKRQGIVKVDKKQIWDNRYNAGETPEKPQIDKKTGEPIRSTLLTKSKVAAPGMLLRLIK